MTSIPVGFKRESHASILKHLVLPISVDHPHEKTSPIFIRVLRGGKPRRAEHQERADPQHGRVLVGELAPVKGCQVGKHSSSHLRRMVA